MKLISSERIGKYGYPIKEIYNNRGILLYEAHDEIECEYNS